MTAFACPCCGNLPLRERPPGTFAICPVCFWEDDLAQFHDRDFAGGANTVSLNEAKANYARTGAIHESAHGKVRPPTAHDRPS